MNNFGQPDIRTVEGDAKWNHENATRLVRDAYPEKEKLTDPEAISAWWRNMSQRLQRLGLSETATVAEYVQAASKDVEERMKDLKSNQL